jgi:predicted nucleotidyltransferase
LSSSVLVWPDRATVDRASREWAARESARHQGLVRLGYFGSYARGDWGVGSDLDFVAVVRDSTEPFHRRSLAWDLTGLPVPAEILVYTEAEWRGLLERRRRFARTLERETVWLVGGLPPPPAPTE